MRMWGGMLGALILLAGCTGEPGPMGPQGPPGMDGTDGKGIVSLHFWYNEDPLRGDRVTVPIPDWTGLEPGQTIIFQAWASAVIDGAEGLVELPMLTTDMEQAGALLSLDPPTVTFTYLDGWYVAFSVIVIQYG